MPNTFFGLTIGTTGMYGSNVGINTTAHNISNTETKGYSRQVVDTSAGVPLRANGTYGMIGTGVEVLSITQQRDAYYDTKYRSNNAMTGYYDSQYYYMQEIENYFNEVQLEGFNTNFNKLFDSIQELSKNPASLTVRTQLNNYGSAFSDYVNSMMNSMKQVQENVNFEIKTMADRVTSLGSQIAGLTKQINTLEVTGNKANDLRDQRANLVDELSNIVDISITEHTVGQASAGVTSYTIKIGDAILVDTYESHILSVVPRTEKINQTDVEGLYELQWESGQNFDALHNGGRMQALLEMRDGNNEQYFNGVTTASYGDGFITVTDTSVNKVEQLHIAEEGIITIGNREYTYNGFKVNTDEDGNFVYEFALDEDMKKDVDEVEVRVGQSISYKGVAYYMSQLNEFTRVFAQRFNEVHRQGVDLDGEPALDYFNSYDRVTGENYTFEYSQDELDDNLVISTKTGEYAVEQDKNYASYYFMTADRLCVTKAVYDDPRKVATASDIVNGVENNDIVLKMIDLKDDNRMFKQGTPSGFLQALIAELGVDAAKAGSFSQNQSDILATISNQRLSVSGVDMDEEAMNLVRYQNSYNLSAKVISTMNEIYDRLINYMGV